MSARSASPGDALAQSGTYILICTHLFAACSASLVHSYFAAGLERTLFLDRRGKPKSPQMGPFFMVWASLFWTLQTQTLSHDDDDDEDDGGRRLLVVVILVELISQVSSRESSRWELKER